MFRIRLADGEEAVYRSLEELALGLSSGIVTPAAQYFEQATQAWRPIEAHPEFAQAVARAASLVATAELEPEYAGPAAIIPTGLASQRASGPFQIYQMFSRSAAELQARRRPGWVLPAVSVTAALIMIGSVALTLPRSRPAPVSDSAPAAPAPSRRAPGGTPGRIPARSIGGPESIEAVRLAPVNLAAHRSRSIEAANLGLADSARRLGLQRVLRTSLLQSPESLARTSRLLASFRPLVTAHRASLQRTEAAYRDSASQLVKAGIWSRVDEQEWRVRVAPVDPTHDGLRTDSLVAALDAMLGFLAEHAGHFELSAASVRFSEPTVGAEYDRRRATLLRQLERGPATWDRPPALVLLLVDSLNPRALPPRGDH